jgi:hypothetical protein
MHCASRSGAALTKQCCYLLLTLAHTKHAPLNEASVAVLAILLRRLNVGVPKN